MSSGKEPTHEPRLRIRNFRPWGVLFASALLAGVAAISIANGDWDLILVMAIVSVYIAVDVLRRAEWNGRPVIRALAGPSTFDEGWRAVPRDLFSLTFIIVASLVNALVIGLILRTSPVSFIGVGLAVVISIVASVMLIREIRRRSKSEDTT